MGHLGAIPAVALAKEGKKAGRPLFQTALPDADVFASLHTLESGTERWTASYARPTRNPMSLVRSGVLSLLTAVLRHPKTDIVVSIRWFIVVAIRRATIVIIVVPRPAPTNTWLRSTPAKKGYFSKKIFALRAKGKKKGKRIKVLKGYLSCATRKPTSSPRFVGP